MNEKFYLFFYKYGLLIILIIAIFFRFYNLSIVPPGLYPDEAINGNNALQALSTGNYKVFYPENNGREGLFINIQAIFLKFFGNHPWVLRSVSAIFGVLTILGLYLLVQYIFRKKIYSHLIAFLVSFFTATSFWHILLSRIGFRAIMSPAFLVWGVYLLIRSLEKIRENQQVANDVKEYKKISFGSNALFLSILGGLIYGLGMYSYIAYRATPIIIIFIYLLYLWIYKVDFKKLILGFIAFVIASLAIFSPLGIYFIKNPQDFFGRASELSITTSATPIKDLALNTLKTLAMLDFKGDYNWRQNYSGAPEIYWFVGIFFIIGIFFTPFYIFRKKGESDTKKNEIKFTWFVSIFWIITAMLPVVMSNEGIPHALRSILMIPAIFILAGMGAITTIHFIFKKTHSTVIYIFLASIGIILIVQTYVSYFILWGQNLNTASAFNQNYVNIGNQLNQMPQAIKKYVIVNASGVLVNNIPMPAETVMFITDTFTQEKQKEKNIYYLLPSQENQINDKNSVVLYLEPK